MWEQIRRVGEVRDWHKGVLFSEATPKFSFLIWLATHNRLTMGDWMQSWRRNVNTSCVFCKHPMESLDRLFFECRFVEPIWEDLTRNLLKDRYTTVFKDILLTLSTSPFYKTTSFILRYVFQALVHKIWGERNRNRHGEIPSTSGCLIKFIDPMVRNRISSIQAPGGSMLQDGLIIWFGSQK